MDSSRQDGFVTLDKIRKTYGSAIALDDLSLRVSKGEFVTLLGPSGSGKTTCLRAIAGMVNLNSGRILIGGRDVSSVPMNKRNIGMVFQNYSLFPHLTVSQNVAYPLRVRRIRHAEAVSEVEQALALVRLEKFGHRRPSELSGGQQQRVALARALVFNPDVLLLDEPLSALDRLLREEMQYELRRIHREIGTTMICVTHDRTEALTMSERVIVMRDGQIVQDSTPEQVYLASGSKFVAEFLGEVNILPMTCGDGEALNDARGRVLQASRPEHLRKGAPVDLVVRVEQVDVAVARPDMVTDVDPSKWRGVIQELLFLGDAVRLIIGCEPHVLVARVPIDRAAGLREGTHVVVDLVNHRPMVFAREAG